MARDIVARNPAPAYSAEGLAHLVQEIDALLHHLARAEPGVLEACFVDSRGAGVAASKVLPPRAMDAAPETLRNFIERVAAVTSAFSARATGKPAAAAELMPASEYAYLLEVRSFLAQLVLPASVDTILVTQGYHDGLACLARLPGWFAGVGAMVARVMPPLRQDRRGGQALALPPLTALVPAALPVPPPEPETVRLHPATESGWRFARLARRLRRSAVVMVCVTLTFALYVFAGKTLQEEAQRLQSALGGIQQQIDGDFDRNAPRPNGTAERGIVNERLSQLREAGFVFDVTLSYCDQPFLDDNGVIRYARPMQELNCNRLWGVNRAVNQNNRQMQAWIAPAIMPPFRWLFGLFDVVDTGAVIQPQEDGRTVRTDQLRMLNRVGLLRVFPENARLISPPEAEALALRRACETSDRTKAEAQMSRAGGGAMAEPVPPAEAPERPQPDVAPAPGMTPTSGSGSQPGHQPGLARAISCGVGLQPAMFTSMVHERDRIMQNATSQFVTLRLALPINSQTEQASPIRVRVVIEGLTLYVLPVLFAVLGAYVSVLREIRRRADAALLALTEQSRMLTTLVLGASFGAVVSLLAEILRGGSTASPTTAAMTLGLWPLAFLAGYAVSHVFRMLDAAVDRIFGLRHPSDRASPARVR